MELKQPNMSKYKTMIAAKGLIAIGNVMLLNGLTYRAALMAKKDAITVALAKNGVDVDVAEKLVSSGELEKIIEEHISGKEV